MSNLPNILWITTDHQRTDALRCYGSPWAHSPNQDALAASGVRFQECTCQSPACTPSRSSTWTGKYVSTLGDRAYGKGEPPSQEVPLIRYFKDAGYQTAQLGKYDFLNNGSALERDLDICEYGPSPGAELGPWFKGFPEGLDPADYELLRMPGYNVVIGGINPLPPERTICSIMASRAEKFLSQERQEPFFLRLSINVPHMPFVPLPDFYGITDRDKMVIPMPDIEEMKTKPQREIGHIRLFYNFHKLSPEEIMHCRGCFYDLCAELDSAIGRVLDSLKNHGFWDNTIVVLNSDHGTTLGEHGVGTIRTFYEPVVQVPFIWSWPGHWPEGSMVADPVESIDILPTLMDIVGLEVPSEVEGRSLVGQISGRKSDPHRPTFSEYDTSASPIGGHESIPPEAFWHPASDHRVMVRHDGWKLECNYGDSDYGEDGALYNLEDDPDELNNLFGQAEFESQKDRLKQIVNDWIKR